MKTGFKFDEERNMVQESGNPIYRNFWNALLDKYDKKMPTIITFNYDLVLERALLQLLNNINYDVNRKY